MIICTNDDGHRSVGLHMMEKYLRGHFKTGIIAPNRNHSGAGGSLSLNRDLSVVREPFGCHFRVDGTPADAAYIGVHGGLEAFDDADQVVSGINAGSNFSDEVYSSGTFGAAAQGRFLKHAPISFSLVDGVDDDGDVGEIDAMEEAAKVAVKIVEWVRSQRVPKGVIFNVNIPKRPFNEIAGAHITRIGRRGPPTKCVKRDGYYRIGGRGAFEPHLWYDDYQMVRKGCVSITPCNLDLTDHKMIDQICEEKIDKGVSSKVIW